MQAYYILPGDNIDGLRMAEVPDHPIAPNEVRLRVHAVSLNYRDLMVASGNYPVKAEHSIIACSDGAGEVIEVGPAVTRLRLGDRVAASFFPSVD